ncbi:WD40 repeat domain-containing protein [Gemmata sp.]|uniref:WD40 repeat domain-containing protein n=1 Tax=Gemmata sp. TaxID=1914242 RepID=UPI003F6E6168
MSIPITCPACRARLKPPPGCAKTKARCPKCHARVNLAAALDATAYHQDSAASLAEFTAPELPALTGRAAEPTTPSRPTNPSPPARPAPADTAVLPLPLPDREEDPLPYLDLNPTARPAAAPPGDELLTLDDDPGPPAPAPAARQPFRTPVEVTFDSAALFTGACEVVLVPHGLFLESTPYRPFLYAAAGTPVSGTGRELVLTLGGLRAVTVRFPGPDGERVAGDTAAFLAGERPVPATADYRRDPLWLLSLAVIFSLGLAAGPLVMGEATDLGTGTGVPIAVGFAACGLLANAAVVLLLRASVPVKVAAMAAVAVLGTGVFVAAVSAYGAGRKHEADQARAAEPVPVPAPPQPKVVLQEPPPVAPANRLLTAQDSAYRDGVFTFDDGPDEVTAVAVTPGGRAMIAGYRSGATRIWRFDQLPLVDPFSPGPKVEGPVTSIRFDATGELAFFATTGGTAAVAWNDPPEVPVKIPGEPFAAFPFPNGERFATVRGTALTIRYLPTALIKKPDTQAKGYPLLQPKDEVIPIDVKGQIPLGGQRPTFLAWHPTGKLLGGHADGSVVSWGAAGPRFEVVTREHKAAVRVWAASPATGDFATGDAGGGVGLWANKAMTPKVFAATSSIAAGAEIRHLAFSPSGALLAVADAANVVWVWNVATMKPVVQVTRPTPVRALAFGPTDDLILLGTGRTFELWHRPELAKQP